MKKFRALSLLLLLGLLCLALPGCRQKAELPEAVASVLKVKINPEISIFLNAGGEVISVQAENADGQQVLEAVAGEGGFGKLSELVQKIVEASISEGFLKEDGKVSLQFYGEAEALSSLQQTVDAALEQVQQESALPFTVTDPEVAPIGKYRGEVPVFSSWDSFAPWSSAVHDENGILLSADATYDDGTEVSLCYDADRAETTITTLSPEGEREVSVYYANGRLKSQERVSPSGEQYATACYPDGSSRFIFNRYADGSEVRSEYRPDGSTVLFETLSVEGVRTSAYYREDGTEERSETVNPDGSYQRWFYYENGSAKRSESLDAEGRLTVEDFRENGYRERVDITGPGSYVCHEEYNEEGRLMKFLATDSDTGLYVRRENYPSGGRKTSEQREGGSYRLEEYDENGLLRTLVVEEPDGYQYTCIKDEAGKTVKEESTEPSGLYWLHERLEDGRLREYQIFPPEDSVIESYGVLDENGNVLYYTYSYHKQGDDFLCIEERLPDGGYRTEITDHGTYSLDITYPDGTLKHQEIKHEEGLTLITDYFPDGSPSRSELIYPGADGLDCVKEYSEAGGFHEVHTAPGGVSVFVLDVRADGSWNSVRYGEGAISFTETREYVPGRYYYEKYSDDDGYRSVRLDASGNLRLETLRERTPEEANDPARNYDGPASGVAWPFTLEHYATAYESIE